MAAIGLGSLLGSMALLRLSSRPNKGEPLLVGFVVTGAAVAGIGASTSTWLSLVLALVGGFAGVLFVGLSTVVVQAMSSDEFRARALAIWAAAFVGILPFGALLTAGPRLSAPAGPCSSMARPWLGARSSSSRFDRKSPGWAAPRFPSPA